VAGSRPPDAIARVCVFARLWEPGLGDLIQRNIFLSLLRRAFPQAELTQVVGPAAASRFAEFFASHTYADRIEICPEYRDDDPGRWRQFLGEIAGRQYGCCVIDPDSRGLLAEHAAGCGIGIRIGFASGGPEDQFLTRPVKLPRPIFGLPDLLDFARGLAGAVGLPPPVPAEVVPPFPYRAQAVPELPGPVVAVHPGGARHWNRRWPLARFAELCGRLAGSPGASFVLVGSADERPELSWLREAIVGQVAGARVEVSAGDPLSRLASYLSRADVLVGNDSAPAHVAAALRTPTVVLYGPGMTEFMWARSYPRHDGVNRHYACQTVRNLPRGPGTMTMPCRYSCHYPYETADGPYPRCLTDISTSDVHQAVLRQLPGPRRLVGAAHGKG
jgi:ADP-heptose:LPS heptosyltransferase